ncbi:diguanylate cyclase (GGDEF domain) [Sulfurimonas denitrificans DSM 1251]|uniref:diguanylate cyclase n=1 Tax=Sulfurimonas denitrificans (strain ATCC 33889 / DSM 1251) TaxID=326298 RepID=Q30Q08_SULDN|nr:cache domain-containing protein [Sulfurimonas denitrificans]ABB44923.1 diguanylate cyclase (GGDEF domain) [Sulfurimonas denitrificans DSM 1251]MDD3442675.1 cache domain-containing protein [Sulfurimonas denitrificans]
MNDKNIIRFVTFAPIITIPVIVSLFFYMSIYHTEEIFNNSTKNLKQELILKEKNNTISKVKMAVEILKYENSTLEERLKYKISDRVNKAFIIGSNIYAQNREFKSEKEIKKMIVDVLRTMIWNNGESFIFILDKKGTFILAPQYLKHKENKSVIDFQDSSGRYVIKEEINLVNSSGEGYLWDTFTRPNKDQNMQYKQMTFVKDFEIYDWYLGSSEYLDIVEEEIQQSSVTILRNINKNENDYFFIYDMNGKIILHSQNPELEGKNFLDEKDKTSIDVAKKLLQSIKIEGSNFASYNWKNPKSGLIEEKISYFEKIPNTNLMIGSGFYTKEINAIADEKNRELEKINREELGAIKIYSLIFIVLSIFIALFISRKLQEKFTLLKKNLEQKSDELILLNEELEEKVEARTTELRDAYEKMRQLANTDSLTQINNRFSFLNQFNSLLERYSKESKAEFSLIMIDIDFFKKINDSYGHHVGDYVIVEVTKLTKACLRESDIFGRVGGEEFMVLLLHTSLEAAKETAQRIRKTIDEYKFEFIGHATVSIGVISYDNKEKSADMLKRVDIALYEAKNGGRNRVCSI